MSIRVTSLSIEKRTRITATGIAMTPQTMHFSFLINPVRLHIPFGTWLIFSPIDRFPRLHSGLNSTVHIDALGYLSRNDTGPTEINPGGTRVRESLVSSPVQSEEIKKWRVKRDNVTNTGE